jgi:L-iditol 2-dehydrogenase
MKAAFLYGVKDVRVEETPTPTIMDDEVLINVKACAICPSDLRYYLGYRTYPRGEAGRGMSGHEWSGEVVEVGGSVKDISKGDKVVPDIYLTCGKCKFCIRGERNLCINKAYIRGGFAEYAVAPAKNLLKIPEGLTYEEACMAEPVACCLNAIIRSRIKKGDDVVIIGDGPNGLILLQLAKISGAKVIVCGHHTERLELARKLGADFTINTIEEEAVEIVKNLTDGIGADVVITATGTGRAVQEAMQMIGPGGVINLFAGIYPPTKLEIDPGDVHYRQLMLTGSYQATRYHYEVALKLIAMGMVKVRPLISEIIPLSRLKEGFEAVLQRKGLKIVVKP